VLPKLFPEEEIRSSFWRLSKNQ